MNSMYAQYLAEKTDDKIIETPEGFASYRYLNDGRTVYIVDIYVTPKKRKLGYMREMADIIVSKAIEQGCSELLGTVSVSSKNSTNSLKALLAYGMQLQRLAGDAIILVKDI